MVRIGIAAAVLVAIAGTARAEAFDLAAVYRRAEAVVQSLFGPPPADPDIIKPPGNIDPKMALMPPAGGRMRLLEPSPPFRQR